MNATALRVTFISIVTLLVAGGSAAFALQQREQRQVLLRAHAVTSGGDALHGQALLTSYGCGSCHDIPGIRGARGAVGPPLGTVAERSFVAGVLPNTVDNMMRWIVDPQRIDSLTAMPTLGVTPDEARHMVAYLHTLRQ